MEGNADDLTDYLHPPHVIGGNGFSMDRLPNPRLPLWYAIERLALSPCLDESLYNGGIDGMNRCCPSLYLWRHWRRRSLDMVCRWSRRPDCHHVRANPYQVLANLLALAAVCPFVGSLSDLIGRRYVALCGAFFLILGMVVSSTAHSMNTFICERASPVRSALDGG